MSSEGKETVKPIRSGRMRGVMIPIDSFTWEHTLRVSGIPSDTPLSKIRVRRYGGKGGSIILKLTIEED